MKFSIIIPTYNRCHLIWKALLSIKNQNYSNFEVLVIDDGSNDKTNELVSEFISDERFKYYYKENGGASSARSLGILLSKGDIITYVDSDEELYNNYLQVAKEFFEMNPEKSFATSNYNRVLEQYDESGVLSKRLAHSSSQKDTITFQNIIDWDVKTCGTGIFHRKENKVFWDEKISLLEDLDFLMSLGDNSPGGFMHIPYALFEYRQRYNTDGQCSLSNFEDFAHGFKTIYDKHGEKLNLKPEPYLGRFDKYMQLSKDYRAGTIPAMKDYIFE